MPGRQRGHPSHTSAWVSQAPSKGSNSTITIQSQVSLVISSTVLTQRTLIKHVTPRKAQSYNTVSGSRPSGLEDRPAVRQRQGNPSYSTVRSETHWCTFVYTYHTPPTSKPCSLFEKVCVTLAGGQISSAMDDLPPGFLDTEAQWWFSRRHMLDWRALQERTTRPNNPSNNDSTRKLPLVSDFSFKIPK